MKDSFYTSDYDKGFNYGYERGYEEGRLKTIESFKKALEKHYTQVIADSLFESIKTFIEEETNK